jgi:hypothetical protein
MSSSHSIFKGSYLLGIFRGGPFDGKRVSYTSVLPLTIEYTGVHDWFPGIYLITRDIIWRTERRKRSHHLYQYAVYQWTIDPVEERRIINVLDYWAKHPLWLGER